MNTRASCNHRLLYVAAALAAVLSIAGWAGAATRATAYSLCANVNASGGGQQFICGARWYSHQFSWHDSTGWTGAKATAVQSVGPKWNAVADTMTISYDPSPTGPYQVSVYRYDLDSLNLFAPGYEWNYGSSGDIYNVVGADVVLNSTWTWYTDGTMSQSLKRADVLTVTLHEMGHAMVLGHPSSSQSAAVMYPQYVKKWNLTADDIAGMQALYY